MTASPASAAVLHDQFDNLSSFSTNSSDPPGAANAFEVADDFAVPAGQLWSLEGVDVAGVQPGITSSVDVSIYSDVAGLPGAAVASRNGVAPTGTDPNWSVPLTPTVQLSPGTYWVGVQVNVTASAWGWVNRTVQSGASAALRSEIPVGPCAGDFVFRPKVTCLGMVDPDQVFRLRGTAAPVPPVPTGAPVPACAGRTATVFGTNAAETLSGTAAADVIAGLGGKDRIKGLRGNDVICGGAGKDTLIGGPGRDRLLGGRGRDVLRGGKGRDVLKGGPGKDVQRQ